MKIYALRGPGRVQHLVTDKELAKKWEASNPYRSVEEFKLDSDISNIKAEIGSEVERLAAFRAIQLTASHR